MKVTDEEVAIRANYHANVTVKELCAPAGGCDALLRVELEVVRKEIARAYVIGFASGAEAQAGVVHRRPLPRGQHAKK